MFFDAPQPSRNRDMSKTNQEETPLEIINWVYTGFIQTIGRLCAVNVFVAGYRPNTMTVVFVASINTFFVFFVWMLFTKDWLSIFKCGCCMNLCIQVCVFSANRKVKSVK